MFAVCRVGGQLFAFPDVCQVPSPAGPVPTPFPNMAMPPLGNPLVQKVFINGGQALNMDSKIEMSSGDEAGVNGGVTSGQFVGKAQFLKGSEKVFIGGSPAVHLSSQTGQNGSSSNANGSVLQPSQTKVLIMA